MNNLLPVHFETDYEKVLFEAMNNDIKTEATEYWSQLYIQDDETEVDFFRIYEYAVNEVLRLFLEKFNSKIKYHADLANNKNYELLRVDDFTIELNIEESEVYLSDYESHVFMISILNMIEELEVAFNENLGATAVYLNGELTSDLY